MRIRDARLLVLPPLSLAFAAPALGQTVPDAPSPQAEAQTPQLAAHVGDVGERVRARVLAGLVGQQLGSKLNGTLQQYQQALQSQVIEPLAGPYKGFTLFGLVQ